MGLQGKAGIFLIDWVPSTNDPSAAGYLDAPVPVTSPLSTLDDPHGSSGPKIKITPKSIGQDTNGKWIKVDVTVP